MKITIQTLLLTLALMLGFSPRALSSNNLPKTAEQEMLGDSTKVNLKNLPTSVYQVKSDTRKQKSVFDQMVMSSNDVLEIKLTTDLQNLIVNKNKDDYQVAYIETQDANGNSVSHELKVKPRGRYRRKICDFPPLKLNFSKEELIQKGLHPQFDKLKLVTHCTDNKMDSKDNVLREYLTYQIYNKLTDNSFRTQLVKIEYIDLHNSSKSITRYGFLIEDKNEMAMRLNGEIHDCHGLDAEMVSKTPYNLMAMFQYMIGNEDWDLTMVRNVKAVKLFTGGGMENNILVPYDFDFSGVVDAPYAIPATNLKHRTVKQRHFSGEFLNINKLEVMSSHFLSRKKEILQTVKKFKRLNSDSRIEIERYLKEFFLILENEKQASDVFLNHENFSFNQKP